MNNKKIISRALLLCAGLWLSACKEDIPLYEQTTDSKDQVWLSIQRAADGPKGLSIFPIEEEERTEQFSVNYGGLGLPASAIQVDYAVDQAIFDSLNVVEENRGNEPFTRFPEGSFTLDKSSSTIAAGETGSDIVTFSYKPAAFDITKRYLLALTGTTNSGYSFRDGAQTIIFTAEVVKKTHDKTEWTASASSEEPAEGDGNGLAAAAIDGDAISFWHSQWDGASPPFPHWVEVDLGGELYVSEIGLTRRQNNNNGFKTFDIEGTRDGKTWVTLLKDAQMEQEPLDMQVFELQGQYVSKIRVLMKDNFNNQASTHLGEIDLMGY